ncbi:MAG: hypothetical protein IPL11_00660 [Candidatus Accumulibacter sp.]|nr:hypothetical protein [Accumulibacter sp.]
MGKREDFAVAQAYVWVDPARVSSRPRADRLLPRIARVLGHRLLCASYIFGFVLWICSFLLVLDLWGMFAVVVGLLMAGIGIVSVAILAALFHADWESLGGLAIMIGATFGVRFLSVWLASKADREREVYLA